jgi:hypothetical protein
MPDTTINSGLAQFTHADAWPAGTQSAPADPRTNLLIIVACSRRLIRQTALNCAALDLVRRAAIRALNAQLARGLNA